MTEKMCIKYIDDENSYENYLNNLNYKELKNEYLNVCDILDELKYQYRYLSSYLYVYVIAESKSYGDFYKKQNIDKKCFLYNLINHLEFVGNCANDVLKNINKIYTDCIYEESRDDNLLELSMEIYKDIKKYYHYLNSLANRMDYEIYSSKIALGEDVDKDIEKKILDFFSFVFGLYKLDDGSYDLDKRIEWLAMLHDAIEVIEEMI